MQCYVYLDWIQGHYPSVHLMKCLDHRYVTQASTGRRTSAELMIQCHAVHICVSKDLLQVAGCLTDMSSPSQEHS